MKTEIITIDQIDVPALFGDDDKAEKLLADVGTAVTSIVVDPSTLKGRKEIASVAAKIPRLKTAIDGIGKDMVSEIKAKAKAIDSRRKTLRDGLDQIRTDFRQPLTDFEENEKDRVRALDVAMTSLDATLHMIQISDDLVGLEKFYTDAQSLLDRDWAEYKVKSTELGEQITVAYNTKKTQLEEAIRLAEENARLKKEAEERAQKEREERIAREAVEKAQREQAEIREAADRKAKAQREETDRRRREAEEDKLQAERDALEAQRRELDAIKDTATTVKMVKKEVSEVRAQADNDVASANENARIADENARIAEEKANEAERKAKIAEEQAENAAQAERDRIDEENRQQDEHARSRAADKAHRSAVNDLAAACLIQEGVSVTAAKKAVTLIAQGKIEAVTISY